MPDLLITCPHCNMQITFGIGTDSAESRENEIMGFVFKCPNCHTPVSYQAKEDFAVELDKKSFENFQRVMEKKMNELDEKLKGVAFARHKQKAESIRNPIDESAFSNMLKDIRESDNYEDFLKRIEE